MLSRATTERSSTSGKLGLCWQLKDRGLSQIVSTEGTRVGPPEVLQALMEGGPVDSSQYRFYLHIKIETGHMNYKWMNDRVIIGRATRVQGEVAYDAYFLENSPLSHRTET